jgi:hypothetical protein
MPELLTTAEASGVQIVARLDAETRDALVGWIEQYQG